MARDYIKKFDKNNNGKLDAEESSEMMKEISYAMVNMVTRAIRNDDPNFVVGKILKPIDALAEKTFKGIDKNKDGEIEESELAAAFETFFKAYKLAKEGAGVE
jgi:Ca2+-binding EF-hand superfamily protein